jgi:hypothetical protein
VLADRTALAAGTALAGALSFVADDVREQPVLTTRKVTAPLAMKYLRVCTTLTFFSLENANAKLAIDLDEIAARDLNTANAQYRVLADRATESNHITRREQSPVARTHLGDANLHAHHNGHVSNGLDERIWFRIVHADLRFFGRRAPRETRMLAP